MSIPRLLWRADAEVETPSSWQSSPVYEFIKARRPQCSHITCRVLEVAQSGPYDRLQQQVSNHARRTPALFA
jgi:hypothetical protein